MALPHTQGLTEAPDGLDTATVNAAILGDREAFESTGALLRTCTSPLCASHARRRR